MMIVAWGDASPLGLLCAAPLTAGTPRNAPKRLRLPTSCGIAWRRVPIPPNSRLPGRKTDFTARLGSQAVRGGPFSKRCPRMLGFKPKATGLGGVKATCLRFLRTGKPDRSRPVITLKRSRETERVMSFAVRNSFTGGREAPPPEEPMSMIDDTTPKSPLGHFLSLSLIGDFRILPS
jgi:hypothetical protein